MVGDCSSDEDAANFAEEAGFDFTVADYEPPTEISAEVLRTQINQIVATFGSETCEVTATSAAAAAAADSTDGNGTCGCLRKYDAAAATCDTLVVAFAALGGFGGGGAGGDFEFVGVCERARVAHALFLKDVRRAWYLLGIERVASDFDEVVAVIVQDAVRLQPSHVVMLGASMGGYAAIRAGLALNGPGLSSIRILAFAPQICAEPAERALLDLAPMAFDADLRRCKERCDGLRRLPSAMDALLRNAPDAHAPGGRDPAAAVEIEVHVGDRQTGDVHEALLLREAARGSSRVAVHVEVHRGLGHLLARDLRASGQLEGLLHRVLARDAGGFGCH